MVATAPTTLPFESCSKDPIGFEGSKWNLYQYVEGRSLAAQDPSGLKGATCAVAIGCVGRQLAACALACSWDSKWDHPCDKYSDCVDKCSNAVLEGFLQGTSDAVCYAAVFGCFGRIVNEIGTAIGPQQLPQPVMPQGPQGPIRGF